MLERERAAVERWADALNRPKALEHMRAAVMPDARIEHYGVWDRRGELVEVFEGHAEIEVWLSRTPGGIEFSVVSEASPVPGSPAGEFQARYQYEILGSGFTHGGMWRFRVSDDGRLVHLAHLPDAMDNDAGVEIDWGEVIAERSRTIGTVVVGGSVFQGGVHAHDHSHDHAHSHDHSHASGSDDAT